MLLLSAFTTPKWLLGPTESILIAKNRTITAGKTLGIYNKCFYDKKFTGFYENRCIIYAITFTRIASIAWRACIVFLAIALLLLLVASLFAVISICKQLIRRKSLMNLAGILQAFAGICLIVCIILFPLGWDNSQVQRLCHKQGDKAAKFEIGDCSIGISYYLALGATGAAFLCSMFSFVADKAVFSHKVQDEILEGKSLICLP